MSRNEWEQGKITLPTAAVAPLKQALRRAQNEMHDAVLDVAKRWEPYYVDQKPRRGYMVVLPEPRTEAERHAHQAISDRFHRRTGAARLGRLTATDLDHVVGPRPTNRTTEFRCGHASIGIEGRELTWQVDENNYSVAGAHEDFLARALMRALASIDWTRGTGGIFWGNNEHNEDAWGASGDYVTHQWGPAGKAAADSFSGFGRDR